MSGIGVSPAFLTSSASSHFSVGDLLEAIPRIAGQGFDGLQLEVYRAEALVEWSVPAIAEVKRRLSNEGLRVTQFVAHFALEDLRSEESLKASRFAHDFLRFMEIAAAFVSCPVVTLPVPPFAQGKSPGIGDLASIRSCLVDLLGAMLQVVRSAGKRLALELMPYSIVGGTEGFLRLRDEAGLEDLAYNFDTGHAWARRERVELIPAMLGEALVGTHLCDNDGARNDKLRPGAGSIDFGAVLRGLEAAGYAGSLDLEILCQPGQVEEEYALGKAELETRIREMRGK